MVNAWMAHVKKTRMGMKGASLKEVLKAAKKTYKKGGSSCGSDEQTGGKGGVAANASPVEAKDSAAEVPKEAADDVEKQEQPKQDGGRKRRRRKRSRSRSRRKGKSKSRRKRKTKSRKKGKSRKKSRRRRRR